MTTRLTLQTALTVAQGALGWAEGAGLQKLAVAVLDPGGHLIAGLRADKAGHFGIGIAAAKAVGVLGFNVPASRMLAEAFANQPGTAAVLSGVTGFLPLAGGIAIRSAEGEVIGAAGAAGGLPDQDEQAVLHGLKQAGF